MESANFKYFNLNNNVYLVDGCKLSAIYDFNKRELYSVNKTAKELIENLLLKENYIKNLTREEINLLNVFLKEEILVESREAGVIKNIKELYIDFPVRFAWLEITRQCNMSCSFCYEKSNPSCTEQMSFNDFQFAIDNLKAVGVKRIQFIGGEPLLLNNVLKKMVCYCRKDFEFIEVYSNGILINKEWCGFFKENNVNVALSIHSYIPTEHDNIVNLNGAHKKVSEAVNLLKKYGIKYRVAAIRNKYCDVGKPHEATPYRIYPTDPKIIGKASINCYNFKMFKDKVITKATMRYSIDFKRVAIEVMGNKCFLKNFYIGFDLVVYPCVMERRINYGNLRSKSLVHMLSDPWRSFSKDSIDGCKECEYRYACCLCIADANGNKIHQKPWYCSYDPIQGKWQNIKKMFDNLTKMNGVIA